MRIGIDIMGGDYAPEATIIGAILAQKELCGDVKLVLIGDKDIINKVLNREKIDSSLFDIVHTTEVIGMGDHPAKAFSANPDSSIVKGFKLLLHGEIDGFTSAGNTGAMLIGAMFTIKSIPGIIRPCIAASLPNHEGKYSIILDVGLNPDARPDVLYQYGILGSIYAEHVYGIKNPRIGLLNIGSEEEKGNLITKSTYQSMNGSGDFNFVGNVEGNDLFSDKKADVIVCDGFIGNVVIKEAEAFYSLLKKRNIKDEFFERFNFENIGGTPILGIKSNVVIGHGISGSTALKAMIIHTKEIIEAKLSEKFIKAFKKWQN
ncbi:phosphate acyltransferase [Bacteroidota bacterium]